MTKQDLDRLISKTELDRTSKVALKAVRRAMLSGKVGDPRIGQTTWSITIQADGDFPARMTFSLKRD
jgi:hypothetical protein